jgi:hypothetical protein
MPQRTLIPNPLKELAHPEGTEGTEGYCSPFPLFPLGEINGWVRAGAADPAETIPRLRLPGYGNAPLASPAPPGGCPPKARRSAARVKMA